MIFDLFDRRVKQMKLSGDYLYHPLQVRENLLSAHSLYDFVLVRLSQKPVIICLQYINNLRSKLLLWIAGVWSELILE